MNNNRDATSQKRVSVEDVIQEAGGMGVYQWVTFLQVGILAVFSAESININFAAATQPHWCKVPALANFSHDQQRDIAIPTNDVGEYAECEQYDWNYDQLDIEDLVNWNRSLYIDDNTTTKGCVDGWEYDRSQYVNTITSRLDLVCSPRKQLVSLISTVFMAGILVGAVLSGYMSDKFGRHKSLYIAIWVKLAGTIMTAFPMNYTWVATTRFLMGVGNSGTFLIGFITVMEIVPPNMRATLGIIYQVDFSIGFMLWPVFAYFIRDDILLQMAVALPLLVTLSFWWTLDESPRWLLMKHRFAEADAIFRRIATINRSPLSDDFSIETIEMEEETKSDKGCLDLMRSQRLLVRTLIIDFHWFTDSLMYYALSLNSEALSGSIYVNTAILGAVEIPANFIAILLLNWKHTGRRLTCSFSLIIAGIASLISIYFIVKDSGLAYTVFSIVAKAFVSVGFNSIYVFTSELMPTDVRNIGIGTASMCARVSGMAAPFIGGPLGDVWEPLPPVVCGSLALISGSLTLLLPETLGRPLLNNIEDAEAFKGIRCQKRLDMAKCERLKTRVDDVTELVEEDSIAMS